MYLRSCYRIVVVELLCTVIIVRVLLICSYTYVFLFFFIYNLQNAFNSMRLLLKLFYHTSKYYVTNRVNKAKIYNRIPNITTCTHEKNISNRVLIYLWISYVLYTCIHKQKRGCACTQFIIIYWFKDFNNSVTLRIPISNLWVYNRLMLGFQLNIFHAFIRVLQLCIWKWTVAIRMFY